MLSEMFLPSLLLSHKSVPNLKNGGFFPFLSFVYNSRQMGLMYPVTMVPLSPPSLPSHDDPYAGVDYGPLPSLRDRRGYNVAFPFPFFPPLDLRFNNSSNRQIGLSPPFLFFFPSRFLDNSQSLLPPPNMSSHFKQLLSEARLSSPPFFFLSPPLQSLVAETQRCQ